MRSDMSPQEFVEGMLTHAWDSNVPRHLGRLECLSDDAAAEAATSEPARRAARGLMDLDAAIDAAVHAHASGGAAAIAGALGALEAVASSHIEGEGLSLNDTGMAHMIALTASDGVTTVAGAVSDRRVDHFAAEKASVLGCAGATRWMLQHGCAVAEMRHAHRILCAGHPEVRPGCVRDVGDNVVIVDQMGRVAFAPPEGSDQIESMVQELVGWVERRSAETQAIIDTESRYAHAVCVAGVAHLRFETIHPFSDGNGRIGRSLAETIIAQARRYRHRSLPVGVAAAFSSGMRRSGYYAALNQQRDDPAQFALWWCEQTQQAAQIAERKIAPRVLAPLAAALSDTETSRSRPDD